MGIQSEARDVWRPEDRSALLCNQLAAPVDFDLRSVESQTGQEDREKTLTAAHDVRITTFKQLFDHPKPPLALLNLTKDFFKTSAGSSNKRDPGQEVAYMMYLLCIVTARIRHNRSISNLKDGELLRATQWAANQDWIDDTIRQHFAEVREYFEARPAGEQPL